MNMTETAELRQRLADDEAAWEEAYAACVAAQEAKDKAWHRLTEARVKLSVAIESESRR